MGGIDPWEYLKANTFGLSDPEGTKLLERYVNNFYQVALLVGVIGLTSTLIYGFIWTTWTKDSRTREEEKKQIEHKLLHGIGLFSIPTILGVIFAVANSFATI